MDKVILSGGIGDKTSNNNSQWYQQDRIYDADGVALCIASAFNPWYRIMKTEVVGMLNLPGRHESACRVHDPNYISPCVNTMSGGGLEPKIALRERERVEDSNLRKEGDAANVRIRKLTPKECWRSPDGIQR